MKIVNRVLSYARVENSCKLLLCPLDIPRRMCETRSCGMFLKFPALLPAKTGLICSPHWIVSLHPKDVTGQVVSTKTVLRDTFIWVQRFLYKGNLFFALLGNKSISEGVCPTFSQDVPQDEILNSFQLFLRHSAAFTVHGFVSVSKRNTGERYRLRLRQFFEHIHRPSSFWKA